MSRTFDWLARPYAFLERTLLGDRLQRTRLGLLESLHAATSVLILGEGDGRFLHALLESNSNAHITVVEGSAAMIERARRRLDTSGTLTDTNSWRDRVRFVEMDVADWMQTLHNHRFDAVVTLFFLDCFEGEEQQAIVRAVTHHTRSDALWLWADFVIPERGLMRLIARVFIALLYCAFRMTTDIRASRLDQAHLRLQAHGWTTLGVRRFARGMLETRLYGARSAETAVRRQG